VESHPIILSPMSRTQSAVAPATPHSPPADAQLPGTSEEAAEEAQEQSRQGDDAPPTPALADAPPEPAADQDAVDSSHEDAAAIDTSDDATELPTPPAADAAAQAPEGEKGEAQSVEGAQQQGGDDEGAAEAGDDSESDPSTPVAVREALAAVHSLAISTGATQLTYQKILFKKS